MRSGPRIVPAGHALGATGGHCDDTYLPPSLQKKDKEEGIGDSPEELKYQVRRQRKFGAEVIKVCATGGVFSRGDTPGQQQLTEDELRAIADEAHMAGHAGRRPRPWRERHQAPRSAPASTPSSMPAWSTTKASAWPRTRQQPVWFAMDIKNTDYTQAEGAKNGELRRRISARTARSARSSATISARRHRAGVRMVFGSDAGVMPHGHGRRSSSAPWSNMA